MKYIKFKEMPIELVLKAFQFKIEYMLQVNSMADRSWLYLLKYLK
jgi:hypothetical protein